MAGGSAQVARARGSARHESATEKRRSSGRGSARLPTAGSSGLAALFINWEEIICVLFTQFIIFKLRSNLNMCLLKSKRLCKIFVSKFWHAGETTCKCLILFMLCFTYFFTRYLLYIISVWLVSLCRVFARLSTVTYSTNTCSVGSQLYFLEYY